SRLIRETIDDYHQQRMNEAEFLKKAKEYENTFHRGQPDNLPEVLEGNENGIAIYNLTTEIFEKELNGKQEIAAEIALGVDKVIQSVIYDKGQLIVDWQNNLDIEGKIKIGIDDYLYDVKLKYDLEFPFDDIDKVVEDVLGVAKTRFK